MTTNKPLLGITIGDPAGVGPEITLKALTEEEFYRISRPLVIGSSQVLRHTLEQLGLPLEIHSIKHPSEGIYTAKTVDVLDIDNIDVSSLQMGVVREDCGQAVYEYIQRATRLALEGTIDAVVTAPINKESLKAARIPYIGHTEMLAAMTNTREEMTLFHIDNVKIFFLTRHLPLVEACHKVEDPDFVYDGIRRAYQALSPLTEKRPTLAVAALNPHAGEGGLLGKEEIEGIIPAVRRAQQEGMDVVGPVPADSVFHFARQGSYDAVLSMYHDQGHIASKMIDFERTVSVTLGLPFLRTSVDHGTAFDIAGKGIASPVSMGEAIRAAVTYTSKKSEA